MGRSRGGLTTKIHALTDARGLPLELVLTPGQAGDCPVAAQLLGHLREGTIVLADKAYDADWLRPPNRSRRCRAQHPADGPSSLETLLQPRALPGP
jgi:transposase